MVLFWPDISALGVFFNFDNERMHPPKYPSAPPPPPPGLLVSETWITIDLSAGMGIQVNLDMPDSMGPGKLVRHMQNPSYTYDEYLICIGLGPSISSVICKNPSYSCRESVISKFTCIGDIIYLGPI